MTRFLKHLFLLLATTAAMTISASAQMQANSGTTSAEDPNDKAAHERSFEETRKHMQSHSDWSKKTGKMNDN